jgi:hypothetical protein
MAGAKHNNGFDIHEFRKIIDKLELKLDKLFNWKYEKTIKCLNAATTIVMVVVTVVILTTYKKQNKILDQTLTIQKDTFELETRPWISLAISEVSIIGKKIKFKCTIENTGKLPALNTHIYTGYKMEGQEDIFEKIRNNLDKMPPGSLTAIAPGSKSIHDYNFDIIVKDNTRYYVIALANYGGPKGSGYYTEFCAYVDFPAQTVFGCADHNIMK